MPSVRMVTGDQGGLVVRCLVYAPEPMATGRTGLVVHLYGRMGGYDHSNIAKPPYDELRRLLTERGYWIAIPELGPEHWMSADACGKVDAVIDGLVRQESIDPRRVHLFGVSMGAAGSLIYVMRRPGKIASVAAVFPVTDFGRWWEGNPLHRGAFEAAQGITPDRRVVRLRELSPLSHPEAFERTPIFLLHGSRDTTVPPYHSREFAAAVNRAGGKAIYREIPGGEHRDEFARPYQRELADFLTGAD